MVGVEQNRPPAGPQHPGEVFDRRPGIGHVLQDPLTPDDIHAGVGHRQRPGQPVDELDAGVLRPLLGDRPQSGIRLYPDHPPTGADQRAELPGHRAGPAADIDDDLAGADLRGRQRPVSQPADRRCRVLQIEQSNHQPYVVVGPGGWLERPTEGRPAVRLIQRRLAHRALPNRQSLRRPRHRYRRPGSPPRGRGRSRTGRPGPSGCRPHTCTPPGPRPRRAAPSADPSGCVPRPRRIPPPTRGRSARPAASSRRPIWLRRLRAEQPAPIQETRGLPYEARHGHARAYFNSLDSRRSASFLPPV